MKPSQLFASAVVLFLPALVATADQPASVVSALARLHTDWPNVPWRAQSAVIADVTCDKQADVVVVGWKNHTLWLGVVPNAKSSPTGRPQVFSFAISAGVQEAVCTVPVRVEVSGQACKDFDYGELPGCKIRPGCKQFAVRDDHCDALFFYWDADHKHLQWFRH